MIIKATEAVRRTSPVPVLVRVGVYLTAVAAMLLAAPTQLRSMQTVVVGMVVLAALAALLPGGAWVTVVVLAAVGGWLVATIGYGEPVTAVRVLALAGVLYLLHSLATLAAALPYDAEVGPDVWGRWLVRMVLVVVVSSLLSVAVLAGIAEIAGTGAYLAATLAGLALTAALAATLSRVSR